MLANAIVQFNASPSSVNVCVALRSADGTIVGSGPTRHSAIATVAS
jgi:hypothetical protein